MKPTSSLFHKYIKQRSQQVKQKKLNPAPQSLQLACGQVTIKDGLSTVQANIHCEEPAAISTQHELFRLFIQARIVGHLLPLLLSFLAKLSSVCDQQVCNFPTSHPTCIRRPNEDRSHTRRFGTWPVAIFGNKKLSPHSHALPAPPDQVLAHIPDPRVFLASSPFKTNEIKMWSKLICQAADSGRTRSLDLTMYVCVPLAVGTVQMEHFKGNTMRNICEGGVSNNLVKLGLPHFVDTKFTAQDRKGSQPNPLPTS